MPLPNRTPSGRFQIPRPRFCDVDIFIYMKFIITEKQYKSLNEDRPVSNELLLRIWDYELGPAIFDSLSSNGVDGKTINDIVKHRKYDRLHNLLMDIGETELARRLKMFVLKSK